MSHLFGKKRRIQFDLVGSQKKLKDTLKLLSFQKDAFSEAQVRMEQFSMLSIAPVLCTFLSVGAEPPVYLYVVFRFEQVHALSLGI